VIDLHCHVLAGIDDGPETIEASIALARAAAALGTGTIVATPHVSWKYRNDASTIARLVEEANTAFAAVGLALDVVPGAEIAMTRATDLAPEELAALTLGDGPWLLIECPYTSVAIGLDNLLLDLQDQGHRILLAHPERCPAFHRDPRMLASLIRAGVLTSITAGSLAGRFGRSVRRFALELAQEDMVHNVSSDAHNHTHRPPGMAVELEHAGLGALVDWLTVQVPAAVLMGEEIPPRPSLAPVVRRRVWRWRRHT
jgi:protein-tyrosine phosphatase